MNLQEKNKIIIYTLIVSFLITTFGCISSYRIGSCPSTDKSFFFKQGGARPTKGYLRYYKG